MRIESKLPNVGTTIFTVMSGLANEVGAINLSQGFPNFNPSERLQQLVLEASRVPKKRVATKPTKGSVKRRLDTKKQQSSTKKMRGRVSHD